MSKTFTVSSLRNFDGRDGTIYVAVDGRVFDVTDKGKELYATGKVSCKNTLENRVLPYSLL